MNIFLYFSKPTAKCPAEQHSHVACNCPADSKVRKLINKLFKKLNLVREKLL